MSDDKVSKPAGIAFTILCGIALTYGQWNLIRRTRRWNQGRENAGGG
jgi:hypothetical protein